MADRKMKRSKVYYMSHDWPEDMRMSEEAFEEYASKLEKEDFEDDVRSLSSTLHQLVITRSETITKLRASADYLDSVWFKCKVGRSLGTSASVVGGGLTIAGGVLTIATAGIAAPLLVAGIATGSVGAATNIGTSVMERAINSKQVKDMTKTFQMDMELTLKIESRIDDLRRYKDSVRLGLLLVMVEHMLGSEHILLPILRSILLNDPETTIHDSAMFISEGLHHSISVMKQSKSTSQLTPPVPPSAQQDLSKCTMPASTSMSKLGDLIKEGCKVADGSRVAETLVNDPGAAACAATGVVAAGMAVTVASAMVKDQRAVAVTSATHGGSLQVCRQTGGAACSVATSLPLKYNPFSPDIFLETGKVVGQNSARLAGQVIVGISAAFLVWDTIDLGITVTDLIRKKGSHAGKVLREKADELETALKETRDRYSLDMMRD